MLAKQCQICNGDYEVKPADWKRGWGKCCSKACAATRREKIIAMEAVEKKRVDDEMALIARLFHHETFYGKDGYIYYRPKIASTGEVLTVNFSSLEGLYRWIKKAKKKNPKIIEVLVEDLLLGDNLDTDI